MGDTRVMLPMDRAQVSSLCRVNQESSCALGTFPLQLGIAPPWGSSGMDAPEGRREQPSPARSSPPRAGFVLEFLAAAFQHTAPGPGTEFGCSCFHAKEKLFSDRSSLLARPRAAAAGQAPSVTSCLFAYCIEPVPKSFGD